jgi:hypothetical protein
LDLLSEQVLCGASDDEVVRKPNKVHLVLAPLPLRLSKSALKLWLQSI